MSKYVERLVACARQEEANLRLLQAIFEARGGTGSVKAFIERGATDPQDGKKQHWANMTPEDQQLWLDLGNTGLATPLRPSNFKNINPYKLTIDKLLTLL